ncbi:DENN domain-containing protein 1B-like isoform X3 [Polyodon spathula]|uniref:DENN domain-containing protein 1B-like isoform X3 n=1 Tax=Polyodon spathula TaxID=7913 RepID=UPI001B7EF68C|nr:DENN domain-containing protein 1B-like isoform X3 [Polyodon spathula]
MDSRINENPARTFDLVLQVECPASESKDPVVLWRFPKDFGDQEVLQTVPKFCFPFDVERVSQNQVGQHFTFVLTDIDGKQRFGFCRLTSRCKVCLCILSYLPWFEIYYKLLNTLADYLIKQQENDWNDMLKSLYSYPVPKPNTSVNLSVNEQLFFATGQALKDQQSQLPHSYFITPDINGLPTIPESRNLTEYFVAVDVNNMLLLYASMMHERRIIITSSKLSTISTLKSKLKKPCTATGRGVAMAFLRTQAALFGSYRDALRYKPGEPISFCEDSFRNHRSSTMRAFLKMAVNLQLFKQFIDGRLSRINAGRGFSDVFEVEITEGGFCGANSRLYQQWMQPVKKGGAMINTAVTKASPTVKTVYKFAKSHAKQGLKEMKSMLRQKETNEEDGQLSMGSPSSTKSLSPKRKQGQRQRKFHRPNTSMGCADFALGDDDDDEMDTASKLSSEDSGEVSACIDNSDDSCEMDSDKQYTGKMDLLGEILDTLSINSSDQGKLSGAKSLDFFRSMDDIDYKVVSCFFFIFHCELTTVLTSYIIVLKYR